MDPVMQDKLATNVANAWKMASNYAWGATGAIYSIWLALTPEQHQAIIAHLPIPVWSVPIVGSVIGIACRLWPQKSLTLDAAEAKSTAPPEHYQSPPQT